MEFTETNRADLSGDLESRVQGLLKQAFPDAASEHGDYYTLSGTPAVIVILREGQEVVGHLAAYRREVEIGCEPLEIGMIGGVAIAPDHRRKGHSRALVHRAHIPQRTVNPVFHPVCPRAARVRIQRLQAHAK